MCDTQLYTIIHNAVAARTVRGSTIQMRLQGTSHTLHMTSALMETEIGGRSWAVDVDPT